MSAAPNSADLLRERSQWPATKGSLTELEAGEADLSATTTIEQRFAMMWQLAQDAWAWRGVPIDESPFSGPAVRIVGNQSPDCSAKALRILTVAEL
jgi:hypothetical protein